MNDRHSRPPSNNSEDNRRSITGRVTVTLDSEQFTQLRSDLRTANDGAPAFSVVDSPAAIRQAVAAEGSNAISGRSNRLSLIYNIITFCVFFANVVALVFTQLALKETRAEFAFSNLPLFESKDFNLIFDSTNNCIEIKGTIKNIGKATGKILASSGKLYIIDAAAKYQPVEVVRTSATAKTGSIQEYLSLNQDQNYSTEDCEESKEVVDAVRSGKKFIYAYNIIQYENIATGKKCEYEGYFQFRYNPKIKRTDGMIIVQDNFDYMKYNIPGIQTE